VPKCKSGSRALKIKKTIFRSPRNEEMLKKWKAAIPVKKTLKDKFFVCEDHFEERFLRRSWVKRNEKNEVIYQVSICHILHHMIFKEIIKSKLYLM